MKPIDMLLAYPKPSYDMANNLTCLSILFPGAMFEAEGKHVAYYDERFDPPEMLDDLVRDSSEIGVSCFTGTQTGQGARILKRAKELNPSIVTGVGGFHARFNPKETLAESFVDRIWPERAYGEEFFPFNDRTRIHYARSDLMYQTSRGCPFVCTFCSQSSPWKPREITQLEFELKTMHNSLGFRHISFSDPNITFGAWKGDDGETLRIDKIKRIRDIGRVMNDIDATWDAALRVPDLCLPGMVDALVEANCSRMLIGCESGHDYFLRKVIKKGHGLKHIHQAAENVRGSGISLLYSFISNMPRETDEMKLATFDLIDWIRDTDPDARVSIYNFCPYPGSPMYEDAVAGNGYPKFNSPRTMEEWGDYRGMRAPVYWIAGLSFRQDNSRKNFPGEDWALIEPYILLAEEKWKNRDVADFPCEEVEALISTQLAKRQLEMVEAG